MKQSCTCNCPMGFHTRTCGSNFDQTDYKLIDCDLGTCRYYQNLEAARSAAEKDRLSDYEIHNPNGDCVVWKLPGNGTSTEVEGL